MARKIVWGPASAGLALVGAGARHIHPRGARCHHQRALDHFFTTKPLGKGTSLGLSVTLGFVRLSDNYPVIDSIPGQAIIIHMPRQVEQIS